MIRLLQPGRMGIFPVLLTVLALAPVLALAGKTHANGSAPDSLEERLAQIDRDFGGSLGVHLRHLGEGWTVSHQADRDWYLASTIKIPLGIALLRQVESGELSLDQELALTEDDFVDGGGELLWRTPGEHYSLLELNRRSIRDSDSTATDLLIGHLGVERFNELVAEFSEPGTFGPITTILQVRHDAWSEVHPDARGLSNLDFIELSAERNAARRHAMVLNKLGIAADQASAGSTREAFRRYYETGYNSGNLEKFARLLERLVRGELLNEQHTEALLEIMESVGTGERRLKAGLPEGSAFAHKTGTQIDRSCHVGIMNPHHPDHALIVMACARDYENLSDAERAFAAIGRSIGELGRN